MISYNRNNRKGSTTVFLCMLLSTLLLLIGFFGEGAAGLASRPYANAVFDLAGRSILSEYDRTLKSRYGLFGFLMDDETAEQKLMEYAGESFKKRGSRFSLLPLEIKEIKVDTSSFAMTNLDILLDQIVDYMKLQIVADALDVLSLLNSGADNVAASETEAEAEAEKRNMRTLRNSKVVNSLPSRLLKGSVAGVCGIIDLPKPQNLGKLSYSDLCINRYILKHFRHNLDDPNWEDTFFNNEIEYILGGRLSDEGNQSIVYLSLMAFRTAVNSAHIWLDETKMNAVTAAAALLGAGVATVAAQGAIIGIWAGAEAAVDLRRLREGGKVPLIKSSEDWVLDLDSAMDGLLPNHCTPSHDENGMGYEDYLFLLLCFKSRECKLIRILDLIQLNIKGSVDKNFSFTNCKAGFNFEASAMRNKGFPGIISLRKGVFKGTHVY